MPLLEKHARLAEGYTPVHIGHWPTPIVEAQRYAATKSLKALFIKREDLSHPVVGGNKVRGLEFLLAEAQRRRSSMILTIGAAGSHHVAATAWHARQLGVGTIALVTRQPPAAYARPNLLLGLDAGIRYIPVDFLTILPRLAACRWIAPKRSPGGQPFYIPPGGTSRLACLGHVNAALELKRQIDAGFLPEPDYLYVALGSLGTAAGLALGCKLAGLRTHLVGVVASYRWYCTPRRWARIARRTLGLMRGADPTVRDVSIGEGDLTVVSTALGKGYAWATPESRELAREMTACEGLELDGTYTAKTLHGMLQHIERNRLRDRIHLFWHTYCPAKPQREGPDSEDALPRRLRRCFESTSSP